MEELPEPVGRRAVPWTVEVKGRLVEGFKRVARTKLSESQSEITGLFPRHVLGSKTRHRKIQARELVMNTAALTVLVSVSPKAVPPPSVVAECLKEADDFFNQMLTGAGCEADATQSVKGA
eukprot:15462074-Alexandrium_andersonii.AAC.2